MSNGRSLASMRRIWVLMGTVFVDMIGFLVVLPLLPYYGERYGASDTVIGLLIAIFAFAQLTSAPLWGRLSDRLGRRPVILGSLLLSAAAFVLFGFTARIPGDALSLALLFASRFIQGVGGGTTGVLQAYVSDSVEPEQRTRALGWVTAATSAGVMVGPLIGSLAVRLGDEAPGYIAAGLCLLNFVSAWLLLPESIGAGRREEEEPAPGSDPAYGVPAAEERGAAPGARPSLRRAILSVLLHPASERSRLIWTYALGMMAFMAMNGVIVLYLDRRFGVAEEQIGWFYTYVGGVSLLMRALLLGPINERLGDVGTVRVGALCLTLGLAVMPLPGSVWGLAGVVLLVPIGTALLFPATTSLVSRHSLRSDTGQNLGVQQAFGGISRMVGPIWSTAVFQHVGWSAPFWVAAVLMAGAVGISLGIHGPDRRPREAEGAADPSVAEPVEPG
jgi:MFS family permease